MKLEIKNNVILSGDNTKLLEDENTKLLIQDYSSNIYYIDKSLLKETQFKGIYTYNDVVEIPNKSNMDFMDFIDIMTGERHFSLNKTEYKQLIKGENVNGLQIDLQNKKLYIKYNIVVVARV